MFGWFRKNKSDWEYYCYRTRNGINGVTVRPGGNPGPPPGAAIPISEKEFRILCSVGYPGHDYNGRGNKARYLFWHQSEGVTRLKLIGLLKHCTENNDAVFDTYTRNIGQASEDERTWAPIPNPMACTSSPAEISEEQYETIKEIGRRFKNMYHQMIVDHVEIDDDGLKAYEKETLWDKNNMHEKVKEYAKIKGINLA